MPNNNNKNKNFTTNITHLREYKLNAYQNIKIINDNIVNIKIDKANINNRHRDQIKIDRESKINKLIAKLNHFQENGNMHAIWKEINYINKKDSFLLTNSILQAI